MNTRLLKCGLLLVSTLLPATVMAYDFVVDGIYYNYTQDGAVVTHGNTDGGKYRGTVNVPSHVRYNNTTINVIGVGPLAFKGCSNMSEVTLPESIQSIDYSAFESCWGLESITLPQNVVYVGPFAFMGCTKLMDITSMSPTPPMLGFSAFEGVNDGCVLRVPSNANQSYAKASGWDMFYNNPSHSVAQFDGNSGGHIQDSQSDEMREDNRQVGGEDNKPSYVYYPDERPVYADEGRQVQNTYIDIVSDDYERPAPKRFDPELERVARDVIMGKYGEYPERIQLLKDKGYDYYKVQEVINEYKRQGLF